MTLLLVKETVPEVSLWHCGEPSIASSLSFLFCTMRAPLSITVAEISEADVFKIPYSMAG